jgi:hypothetical protein
LSRWLQTYSDIQSKLGGSHCYRTDVDGNVTGIYVPEWSSYVQPLQ